MAREPNRPGLPSELEGHDEQVFNHRIESWVFSTYVNRVDARGFKSDDVGRIAYQEDSGTYWRLKAVSPSIVWEMVGGMQVYGGLYVADNTTGQSIGSSTWTVITQFDSTTPFKNCTPNLGTSGILIPYPGIYYVHVPCSFECTAAVSCKGAVYLNGTRQDQTKFVRKIGTAGDQGYAAANGQIKVQHANSQIRFRMLHSHVASATITISNASMEIHYLGEI